MLTDRELSSLEPSPSDDRPTDPNKLNMTCQESSGTSKASLTPEEVCPFPKAVPRHEHRGSIKAKTCILTNTPQKNKTEVEKMEREMINFKRTKKQKKNEHRRLLAAKKLFYPCSSSRSDGNMSVHDESDIETLDELMEHSKTFERGETQDILINDFVLVQFATKKTKILFV
jgi:hypothetical protein